MTPDYVDTVRLLLAIAPTVFASGRFAMKGGTALNLFVQDMPRLSIDIDVVYIDHVPDREAALKTISAELIAMKAALKAKGYRATLPTNTRGDEVKLVVGNDATQVKVEVNFVFRGSVLPVERRSLVATAQDLFTTDVALPVLAPAELYGSKLVAAMDRQHPRDIFDVLHMLNHFGWQELFVDCFVVYLAGHNRPVHGSSGCRGQARRQIGARLHPRCHRADRRTSRARGRAPARRTSALDKGTEHRQDRVLGRRQGLPQGASRRWASPQASRSQGPTILPRNHEAHH
jgi:predicted nucleotidyltransferase component of viral defense system